MKASRSHAGLLGIALVGSVVLTGGIALSIGLAPHASTATSSTNDAIGSLPERHLQPPWWQEVATKATTPNTVQVTVPADVIFATDSSAIGADGLATLRSLVPKLERSTSVTIAGCTDSVGGADSALNLVLSQRRADAAEEAFIGFGVNRSILHTVAWAGTHPVTGTQGLDSATVNALNRRIVIELTKGAP